MKGNGYANGMRLEAQHCPVRDICSLAFFCGKQLDDGRYILPNITSIDRREMLWTDLSTRRQVYVVRSGLLVSKCFSNEGTEMPDGLSPVGFAGGVSDVCVPYVASDFYFFAGLVPSQVCIFDGDRVIEQINSLGLPEVPQFIARLTMNQATAAYGQRLTFAHQRARDKVASVLLRLEAALARDPSFNGALLLAHDEIAFLAGTERATTSRQLKAFARDGLIDLSYRRIVVKPALRERFGGFIEANLPFYDKDGTRFYPFEPTGRVTAFSEACAQR